MSIKSKTKKIAKNSSYFKYIIINLKLFAPPHSYWTVVNNFNKITRF